MEILNIEGLISVRHSIKNGKAFQCFTIENKNIKKYLLDNRFSVYYRLKDKIEIFSLSNKSDNYIFLDKKVEDNKIILEFKIVDESKIVCILSVNFVISGFVPKNAGCDYCKYRKVLENNDVFFYCLFKEKTLTKKIKNCQFFRQIDGLLKT